MSNRAGYKAITIYLDRPYLPDIVATAGESGRGYIVTFVGSDGKVIKPSDNIQVRCWGLQDETGKTYYQVATIAKPEADTWICTVPPEVVRSDGYATVQIVMTIDGREKLSTTAKTILVGRAIDTGTAQGDSVYVDYGIVTTLATEARGLINESTKIATEARDTANRAANDLKTIEQGEASRASKESARESAESARKSAESGRESAESNRKSAEQSRASSEQSRKKTESSRESAEQSRKNAESERVSAESSRNDAESMRQQNERTRQVNEDARKKEESARASAESTRQSAESSRQSAEGARAKNETTRQNQESARVDAENKRKATFAGWDKTMQGVIPNATELATGVVRVSGMSSESAPYTVPSVGKVNAALAEAGKVKSVNGMTGDVTIPAPDLSGYATKSALADYATKTELSTKADKADLSAKADKSDIKVTSVNGQTGDVTIQKPDLSGYATKTDLSTKADKSALSNYAKTSTLSNYATTSALSSLQSTVNNKADKSDLNAKANASDVSALQSVVNSKASSSDVSALRGQVDGKQDKIKIVTTDPTADSTSSDPDGTIYLKI
ncbi:hypothetical protein [Murdochiella massiliensis]|uniref:hypothetical protein n=1 Tax=Murdochiella massiliensis TaxID=1673723 RepID=UPI000833012B|nr:hypothetical protein [Murdochiella massiliensis]